MRRPEVRERVPDVSKTENITCPECGRTRRVRSDSATARSVREKWSRVSGRCKTCKALHSILRHRTAIAKLETFVMRRRMRGL